MQTVTLIPVMQSKISIEAETITPNNFAGKTREEIENITIWEGNHKTRLFEFFKIALEGKDSPENTKIIINGSIPRVKRVGEGMTDGMILINGDVDMHVGAKMQGGVITVKGNADSWAGREMKGGEIIIGGDAGYYLGAGYRGESCGMRGGKIIVFGDVKDYAGEHICGGEILIKGSAGLMPGISNNGGIITIEGNTEIPGAEMKKGTIKINGVVETLVPSYKQEDDEEIDGIVYNKYTGDVVAGGKGSLYIKK
ncbi:MAG: formylmethanofuran dehydrogenase subunit C [Methanosarcinales archaeon]|nr:MAG: formylmethanofuran dehydrogenase subunit C [Methanosarcinales archaeon]